MRGFCKAFAEQVSKLKPWETVTLIRLDHRPSNVTARTSLATWTSRWTTHSRRSVNNLKNQLTLILDISASMSFANVDFGTIVSYMTDRLPVNVQKRRTSAQHVAHTITTILEEKLILPVCDLSGDCFAIANKKNAPNDSVLITATILF